MERYPVFVNWKAYFTMAALKASCKLNVVLLKISTAFFTEM